MAGGPVAIGLMAASALMEGIGQNSALRAQARAQDENARREELAGELDVDTIRRRERATSGEAIAALGANGVRVGTGSALDLLHQNAAAREADILNRRYNAASEADSLRRAARQSRRSAKFALFSGVLRAGAAAMTPVPDAGNAVAGAGAQQLPIPTGPVEKAPGEVNMPGWKGAFRFPVLLPKGGY
ncbi:hypothetical protein ACMT1E_04325 [Sphingomonas flavalba]|uniref:hypothetical protein n=1 Tax=Sphingomonas flavalba TaxID=2559804 RepID=UPI0039E1DE01